MKQLDVNKPRMNRSKKFRKGDHVLAISGDDKGRHGVVLKYIREREIGNDRVVVQGLNMQRKHAKRTSAEARTGILDIEGSMHVSNVRLCTAQGVPLKVKVKTNAQGKRELYHIEGGQEVTYRAIKSS